MLRVMTVVIAGLLLNTPLLSAAAGPAPAVGRTGAIATRHFLASEAGLEILRAGGNAVDAAVAAAFAVGVVHPWLSGIGGDGQGLVYLADRREVIAIMFLGRAPLAATAEAMADLPRPWVEGPKSVTVPGAVAGLLLMHERFGSLPLPRIMQPAIRLAQGFPVTAQIRSAFLFNAPRLLRYPESSRIFLPGGRVPSVGETFAQPDLRRTLERIAAEGRRGFYEGPVAEAIARAMSELGGLISREDLTRYEATVGPPLRITYRGHEVFGTPPPSGGLSVLQTLKLLEGFDLARLSERDRLHVLASAFRIATADLGAYLGDPAVVRVPIDGQLSDAYAAKRRRDITMDRAPALFAPGDPRDLGLAQSSAPPVTSLASVRDGTSHLVAADRHGNVVTVTLTLGGLGFGSAITVPDTGIVLNNVMEGFSDNPRSPRRLIGGSIRQTGMAPLLALREGRPLLLIGAAGAIRIAVPQVTMNVLDLGMSIDAAIAAGRIEPTSRLLLRVEERIPVATREALAALGYQLETVRAAASDVQGLLVRNDYHAATDSRHADGRALAY
jgi:gamma-glutamyltranspeptidase/glutathione hydrolase